MTNIIDRNMFEQNEHEQDEYENDEVVYYSFLPMFDDEDTYKMSDGRKQAFIRVAKWLFDCAGVTPEEFVKQTALDKPQEGRQ
jgi:hypothetical protein